MSSSSDKTVRQPVEAKKTVRQPSTEQKTARQPTGRTSERNKPEPMIAIALSDMEHLMRSARSARCNTKPARSAGCECSCHLLNDVIVSPRQASFPPQGAISTHNLSNASKTSLAVKITCSDNSIFRVNPVFVILQPGSCVSLHIGRVEAPPKRDRLCILLLEHDGVLSARETFKRSESRPATISVPLTGLEE